MNPELEQELESLTEDENEQGEEQEQVAPQIRPEDFAAYAEQMGMQLVPKGQQPQMGMQTQEPQFEVPEVPQHIQEMGWQAEQAWIAQETSRQQFQQFQQQMMMQQAPAQFAQMGQQLANEAGRPELAQQMGEFLNERLGGNYLALQQDPALAEFVKYAAKGWAAQQGGKPLADAKPVPRAEGVGREIGNNSGGIPVPDGMTPADAARFVQDMGGNDKDLRKAAIETLREMKEQGK